MRQGMIKVNSNMRQQSMSENCIGNQWKSEANKQHAISEITSEVVKIWNKARVVIVARNNVFKRIKHDGCYAVLSFSFYPLFSPM